MPSADIILFLFPILHLSKNEWKKSNNLALLLLFKSASKFKLDASHFF